MFFAQLEACVVERQRRAVRRSIAALDDATHSLAGAHLFTRRRASATVAELEADHGKGEVGIDDVDDDIDSLRIGNMTAGAAKRALSVPIV